MPVAKRLLPVWPGDSDDGSALGVSAPPPTLSQVLYTPPNPDLSRKMCGNCSGWVRNKSCKIHAPDVVVPADGICGYHMFGTPHTDRGSEHPNLQYADPEMSGLEQVPGGVSCDRCRFYTMVGGDFGTCAAVVADGARASVAARGCCTRWVRS